MTMTPLPVLTSEGYPACVRSGFCCRQAVCPFGEWDAVAHQCRFLVVQERQGAAAFHGCSKYDEIAALPRKFGAAISPAFGGGCSSTMFNKQRMTNLRVLRITSAK